jgi:uncharacterized repeat protein (TIGR03803 family)
MKVSDFGRYALSGCVAAALLAGCGGSQPPIGAPPPAQAASSRSSQPLSANGYQLLYTFRGNSYSQLDGAFPHGSLIAVENRLYGTTAFGGDLNYGACGTAKFFAGCGTVFEVSTSGNERVLYRFAGGNDGYSPYAGLLGLNGTLYGTTSSGGGPFCKNGYYGSCGTVFALSLSGQEHVLHSFAGPPDGERPSASLIAVSGALYGTTAGGGSLANGCWHYGGCGVVFEVNPSGSERVLYAFKSSKDGAFPSGPLLSVHGTLYGTTNGGGSGRCGTAFKVSTSGTESVVHSFSYSSDGCRPVGGFAAIDGALYGATEYGGGGACNCGAVFKLSTMGTEKVIYRFKGGADGSAPFAGLIAFKGTLYGTTLQGGGGCSGSRGCGTAFKVTTSGAEQVLYAFKGGTAGEFPEAGLWALRGALYGTTAGDLAYACGYPSNPSCGTIFKISP